MQHPYKSHSWLLESSDIAIKLVDKTFVKSLETGVPLDIIHFFSSEFIKPGEHSSQIEFVINDSIFDISLKNKNDGRHKLVFTKARRYLSKKEIRIGDVIWFERCSSNFNRFYVYTKSEKYNNSILPFEYANAISEYDCLTKQRIGQSYFKSNVSQVCNNKCIVTDVSDSRVLIASHIKPWRYSSNSEKYDGHNGLLLSPHIDKLFDKGLITFDSNGLMVKTKSLNLSIFKSWNIDLSKQYEFSDKQFEYLEYHQSSIFKYNKNDTP